MISCNNVIIIATNRRLILVLAYEVKFEYNRVKLYNENCLNYS